MVPPGRSRAARCACLSMPMARPETTVMPEAARPLAYGLHRADAFPAACPGADDAHAGISEQAHVSLAVEAYRRIRQFLEQRGVAAVGPEQDGSSEFPCCVPFFSGSGSSPFFRAEFADQVFPQARFAPVVGAPHGPRMPSRTHPEGVCGFWLRARRYAKGPAPPRIRRVRAASRAPSAVGTAGIIHGGRVRQLGRSGSRSSQPGESFSGKGRFFS